MNLSFVDGDGNVVERGENVAPLSRVTVKVNDVTGPRGAVLTDVASDIPVVVERAMYWPRGSPWTGGHGSVRVGE